MQSRNLPWFNNLKKVYRDMKAIFYNWAFYNSIIKPKLSWESNTFFPNTSSYPVEMLQSLYVQPLPTLRVKANMLAADLERLPHLSRLSAGWLLGCSAFSSRFICCWMCPCSSPEFGDGAGGCNELSYGHVASLWCRPILESAGREGQIKKWM